MMKIVGIRLGMFTASALLAGALGCGTLETHHVITGPPGPPYGGDVRVLLEGVAEPPGLQEVAIVQAVGSGQKADLEDLMDGLKAEARSLGCDTVIHVHVDQGAGNASANGVAARSTPGGPPGPPPPTPGPTPPAPSPSQKPGAP